MFRKDFNRYLGLPEVPEATAAVDRKSTADRSHVTYLYRVNQNNSSQLIV